MGIAILANDLAPYHAMTGIRIRANSVTRERQPETRPAGARIVLVVRLEQSRIAADTSIDPVCLVIDVFTGKRAFGSAFLRYLELLRIELVAQVRLVLDSAIVRSTVGLQHEFVHTLHVFCRIVEL